MMTERPGAVSTMSAAARAASVAPSTAMPIWAFLSAGASFTPSPVIPTVWPAPCTQASDTTHRGMFTSSRPLKRCDTTRVAGAHSAGAVRTKCVVCQRGTNKQHGAAEVR